MQKYSKFQLAAINSSYHKTIIEASAGTGKTLTLVGAVNKELSSDISRKVAVITFTNAAADEIGERLRVKPYFTGTIHSFAASIIKKLDREKKIVNKTMSEKAMKRLLVKAYISCYDLHPNYKAEVAEIYSYMLDHEFVPSLGEAQRYKKVIRAYNELKEKFDLTDFMDYPKYLCQVMDDTGYVLDYDSLYVDEVQDIDIWEFSLIERFEGKVFLIGDPRQEIYQFRNSYGQIFEKFEKLGYTLLILDENYRSKSEILKEAKSPLKALRGDGGIVSDVSYLNKDTNLNDFVVLCRSNDLVKKAKQFYPNVYTVHAYKGLESEKVILINFPEESNEEKNIMFVAKTRARDVLIIDTAQNILNKGRELYYG